MARSSRSRMRLCDDCDHPASFHWGGFGRPCASTGCRCRSHRFEARSASRSEARSASETSPAPDRVTIVLDERTAIELAFAAIGALRDQHHKSH